MPAEANHTILDPRTQREALQQYVSQVTQGMVDEIKLNSGKTGNIQHRLWDIVQKGMIQTVLDNTTSHDKPEGHISNTARLLGINRATLRMGINRATLRMGINRATLRKRIERYEIEANLVLTDEDIPH